MNSAQIAMKGLGRMQEMGACAGRSKCGRDLLPDQSGLAHARDDRAAFAGEQQLYRLAERGIEPIRNLPNPGRLAAHDLARSPKLFLRRQNLGCGATPTWSFLAHQAHLPTLRTMLSV